MNHHNCEQGMILENRSKSPQRFLVSVIITAFNRADSVLEAIANVRAQTWRNTQIIVVDDGSTDETFETICKISDIIVLKQERQGLATARHLGLKKATGTFIAILDSDHLWHREFLESSIEACEKLRADLVFSNWDVLTENGAAEASIFEKFYNWFSFPETALAGWRMMLPHSARGMFLDSYVCPPSGVILRRSSIAPDWHERIQCTDDRAWFLDIVLDRPARVAFTMKKLWRKRLPCEAIRHDNKSICTAPQPKTHDSLQLLRRYHNKLSRDEKSQVYARLAKSAAREVKRQVRHGTLDLRSASLSCRWISAAICVSPRYVAKKLLR